MSTPFTNKFVRKISLSSLLQQRAGLTTMQPITLCPRNSSVCMYFSHWMGLKVWQTTLGKANLLLLQTHPLSVPLPQSTTGKNHCSHGGPSPESSPVVPPCSSSPPITTNSSAKYKHSACRSVGLPTFSNTNTNNLSVSDADVSSCSQTSTSSKQQKINGPLALLSTSKELKKFKNTIKDLLKSKEVNKRWE